VCSNLDVASKNKKECIPSYWAGQSHKRSQTSFSNETRHTKRLQRCPEIWSRMMPTQSRYGNVHVELCAHKYRCRSFTSSFHTSITSISLMLGALAPLKVSRALVHFQVQRHVFCGVLLHYSCIFTKRLRLLLCIGTMCGLVYWWFSVRVWEVGEGVWEIVGK